MAEQIRQNTLAVLLPEGVCKPTSSANMKPPASIDQSPMDHVIDPPARANMRASDYFCEPLLPAFIAE
jgi:hypothetical protein